ncbi:MAG TPA: ArsA family ATPase [Nitrospirota bacterium]|nr:ArsA family ATPase [Nitrospirota bacterium]
MNKKMQKSLVLVGGKGGVGKTTCSAAIAVQLATVGSRTLLITSDMTPSLSDILEQNIGDKIINVRKNLDACEISQASIVAHWRNRFGQDFHDIIAILIDIDSLDTESRHQFLDYIGSAPSLREETMLDIIVNIAEHKSYDRIIWDTAPAGETLNLLGMPKIIRKHLRAGAKIFEGLDRIGRKIVGKRTIAGIMDEWVLLSEKIGRFIHDKSTFLIVANPEALVVNQARRVINALAEYDLSIHGLIINKIIEETDSSSLATVRSLQLRHIEELRKLADRRPVSALPLHLTETMGVKGLQSIGEKLVLDLML